MTLPRPNLPVQTLVTRWQRSSRRFIPFAVAAHARPSASTATTSVAGGAFRSFSSYNESRPATGNTSPSANRPEAPATTMQTFPTLSGEAVRPLPQSEANGSYFPSPVTSMEEGRARGAAAGATFPAANGNGFGGFGNGIGMQYGNENGFGNGLGNGSGNGNGYPSAVTDAFHGIASQPFSDKAVDILLAPIQPEDVAIKPDGMIYLPEIKYRRILNRAFKPGGWALAPRGPHSMSGRIISREYALFALGRYVSQARGEQEVFDEKMLATSMEGCRSNALMRCCKDLGIASELWDPTFIRTYRDQYCEAVWVRHVTRSTKSRIWRKKGEPVMYPYELLK